MAISRGLMTNRWEFRVLRKGSSSNSVPTSNANSLCQCRQGIALSKLPLVPVGIGGNLFAREVQSLNLFASQVPPDSAQILPQLFFIASANNDVGDRRPLQKPVQCDLRDRFSGISSNFLQRINNFVKIFVLDRRALFGS